MSNYITTTSELTLVADAIRAKAGTASTMSYPDGFVSTISAIPAGGASTVTYGLNINTYTTKTFSITGGTATLSMPLTASLRIPNGELMGSNQYLMYMLGQVGSNTGASLLGELEQLDFTCDTGSITVIPTGMFRNLVHLGTLPQILFNNVTSVGDSAFYNVAQYNNNAHGTLDLELPVVEQLLTDCFRGCHLLKTVTIGTYGGNHLGGIGTRAFQYCDYLTTVTILETPTGSISSSAFSSTNNLTDIYVSWSENAVGNAPWGATNATIHYDYNPEL